MFRTLLFLILVSLTALVSQAQTAEDLFQQALRTERLSGNMEAAIALYEQIVEEHPGSREVSARALLHMAKAYEALGRGEALSAYERLVSDYSDQALEVAEARRRIVGLRGAEPDPYRTPASRSTIDLGVDFESYGGGLSPSGRYMVGMAENPFGVRILDLQNGDRRHLPIERQPDDWAQYVRMSPDERTVAVGIARVTGARVARGEILVINIKSGETIRRIDLSAHYDARGMKVVENYPWVQDWSRDGRWLLVLSAIRGDGISNGSRDRQEELLRVPIDGSAPEFLFAMTEGEVNYYEQSFVSADGRYVFSDISGDDQDFIRRFDRENRENVIWRRRSVQNWLWATDWENDSVLYAARELDGVIIRAADPAELDPSMDRVVTRLPSGSWPIAGSKSGDLATWLGGPDGWKLRVASLEDPSAEPVEVMTSGLFAWSPSGDRLLHDPKISGDYASIWHAGDRGRTALSLPRNAGLNGWAWVDENHLRYNSAEGFRYVHNVIDGRADRLATADWALLGIHNLVPLGDGDWIGWSSDRLCAVRIDAASHEREDIRCFDDAEVLPGANAWFIPSPYSDETVVGTMRPDSTNFIGLLALDGSSFKNLGDYNAVRGGPSWISPSEIGFVIGAPSTSGYTILNVDTGERRGIAEDIFERFRVGRMAVGPGLKLVAFGGAVENESEGNLITVIHNVTGGLER